MREERDSPHYEEVAPMKSSTLEPADSLRLLPQYPAARACEVERVPAGAELLPVILLVVIGAMSVAFGIGYWLGLHAH
jgi:hypothetical protein